MRYLLCLLIALSISMQLDAECEWVNNPEPIYSSKANTKYLIFDEPINDDFFKQGLTLKAPDLDKYKQWVRSHLNNTDPYYLLNKQRKFFENTKDAEKFDQIISKKIGSIRRANCIELLLLEEHAKNFDGGKVTHEFEAIILLNHDSKKMRVYFGSGKEASGGAPSLSVFQDKINKDLANNFNMVYSLHNHPFSFDNTYGDIAGTTIPSIPDVSNYIEKKQKFGLKNALITNGISTIEFKSSEFQQLK